MLQNKEKPDRESSDKSVKEFVSLLTSQQARIYNYILSLVPNFSDADDILQETTKLMWEKFDDFTLGTDFLAWGRRIAHFLVLEHYRKKKKQNEFYYDEQLINKLQKDSQKNNDSSRDDLHYLKGCLKKLKQQDRKLLMLRYFENNKAKELAGRFGCSIQYIYRNISRIHQLLLACIQKQMNMKESS